MLKDNPERIASMVYKNWKRKFMQKKKTTCPDEEVLACFKEGLLNKKAQDKVKLHLLGCKRCSEHVFLDSCIQATDMPVPQELLQSAKDLVRPYDTQSSFVVISLKERFIDLVRASADFLQARAPDLYPVSLRGTRNKKIPDQVQLIKYLGRVKVTLRIERQENNRVGVTVRLTEKRKDTPLEQLRVSLWKDGEEMESYVTKKGEARFLGLCLGRYNVEISDIKSSLGLILLELRQ